MFVLISPYKNYNPILKKITKPLKKEIITYIKNNNHHPSKNEVYGFLTKNGCKVIERPDKNPNLRNCEYKGNIFGVEINYDIDRDFESKEAIYKVILHIRSSKKLLNQGNAGYMMIFNSTTLDRYTGGKLTDIPVAFKSQINDSWNTNQYIAKFWDSIAL